MGRPRIILADRDETYIAPLQMKFLEELGDEIDLEIITEPDYFRSLFRIPQSADIVMVSDELYDEMLLRHNIANLFILSEQNEEDEISASGSNRIYKYSSLKEIFGRVMAVSDGSFNMETVRLKETQIILVYSAAGGVGKTTLALSISTCLAQNFKKVLYVDADRLNSFQYYLKDKSALSVDISNNITGLGGNLFNAVRPLLKNEKFDYFPPFSASLSALNIDYRFYKDLIRDVKDSREYDVIVVDTDVVFDNLKAELLGIADKVLMVTTPEDSALFATSLLLKNMNCSDGEKYYFICNHFVERTGSLGRDADQEDALLMDEYVARIPHIEQYSLSDLAKLMDIQRISYLLM